MTTPKKCTCDELCEHTDCCCARLTEQKTTEDHIDRFAEVAKGLKLDKNIAEKLANFVHYEVMNAKKNACITTRNTVIDEVEAALPEEEDLGENDSAIDFQMQAYNRAIGEIRSILTNLKNKV